MTIYMLFSSDVPFWSGVTLTKIGWKGKTTRFLCGGKGKVVSPSLLGELKYDLIDGGIWCWKKRPPIAANAFLTSAIPREWCGVKLWPLSPPENDFQFQSEER
ncbi:hypothetical protein TNCV_2890321 [Trichonephila clavipes]|nr:hypothetical protein TNCV_2890321 [Trichonephila clavipes]